MDSLCGGVFVSLLGWGGLKLPGLQPIGERLESAEHVAFFHASEQVLDAISPRMPIAIRIKSWIERYRVRSLYARKEYLEAYSDHTDRRVIQNPHEAVGGKWEMLGHLQFDFLVEKGLRPHHALLDLGCGTLRGGRHFIRYLGPGRYSGIDISSKAIEYGRKLVEHEGLDDKRPRLVVSVDRNLKFQDLRSERFDFLLAQSVFTHLDRSHIEECFEHVGEIMHDSSIFFFTFYESEYFAHDRAKRFRYPVTYFETLAELHDFKLEREPNYQQPSGQRMARLTRSVRNASPRRHV